MKKFLFALMSITIALTTNAYDFCDEGSGFFYTINSDRSSVTISKYEEAWPNSDLDIPNEVYYNGKTYTVTSIGMQAFFGLSLKSVTIPSSITSIKDYAFNTCTTLKEVIINNAATTIGKGAFEDCNNITSVSLGNAIISIREGAFCGCSKLTNIQIPNSVLDIGDRAFENCSGLKNIVIPSSVSSIGQGAFSGCSGLESISVDEKNAFYDSRDNCNAIILTESKTLFSGCKNTVIPNSVTSIGQYAFYGSALTEVKIPYHINSVGYYAFAGCKSLTSIIIPNTISVIHENVFADCSNVTSITLIGAGAFGLYNYNLPMRSVKALNIGSEIISLPSYRTAPSTIYCYAQTPPSCDSNTFKSYNANLHIPVTALSSYFTAPYWENFNNLHNDITDKIVLNHSSATLTDSKDLQLIATTNPVDAIVKWCTTNPEVATVNSDGVVTAKGVGSCTIYATFAANDAVYASCRITSEYTGISLSLNEENIIFNRIGEQVALQATVTPDVDESPTWFSTNEQVATVDDRGIVTSTGRGECDIIVSLRNTVATCHVRVNAVVAIILDKESVTMRPNSIATIVPSLDANIDADYSVTSSRPEVAVARVANGKVMIAALNGIFNDTTIITVSRTDGEAASATCVVTVRADSGDINCDGVINAGDISAIYSIILGNDSEHIAGADVNGDGVVNAGDISAIYDIILKQ